MIVGLNKSFRYSHEEVKITKKCIKRTEIIYKLHGTYRIKSSAISKLVWFLFAPDEVPNKHGRNVEVYIILYSAKLSPQSTFIVCPPYFTYNRNKKYSRYVLLQFTILRSVILYTIRFICIDIATFLIITSTLLLMLARLKALLI